MLEPPIPGLYLKGDDPVAFTPQGLIDRRELAFVAFERTRMPTVVTDPRQRDNPIILANRAFLDLCGYTAHEVVGRNCRFLQGPQTSHDTIEEIRRGLAEGREISVELLNYRRDGMPFWNNLLISPVHDDRGELLYHFATQKDVTAEHEVRERRAAELRLMREVDHRAKNVLALVQGIVQMSRADTVQGYAASVRGRVQALAKAHALLAEHRWNEVPFAALIEAEVAAVLPERVTLTGGGIGVPAEVVQPLALIVHELAANAMRHGGLSAAGGRVRIDARREDDGQHLHLSWRESGAAAASGRPAAGLGFRLMTAIVEHQLGGSKTWHWHPHGFAAEFRIPLRR